MKINNRVLKVFKGGCDFLSGQYILYLESVNGIDFSSDELKKITDESYKYLSLTDQTNGIELRNINYFNIDFSARIELNLNIDVNSFRVQLQRNFQRKYDYRYIEPNDIISRLDLMLTTQKQNGTKRILDNYFLLNGDIQDIVIPDLGMPRFRSFVLYDLNGNIISNNSNTSNYSTFFQNYSQSDFQALLRNI